MDYQGFTDDSLITMYAGVREALAADDMFRELGLEGRFRVRKTPAWKLHAADLEAEMLRRKKAWKLPKRPAPSGALEKYAALVGPAHLGALTHSGPK